MADTRVQLEVEDWVRQEWMPTKYGVTFNRDRVKLRSGGVFDFDAVSGDKSIIATISTSGAKTAGGNYAVGKMLKIRSDMLFLTMVEAQQRVVLTAQDMYKQCHKEKEGGRVPQEIEFVHASLPEKLNARLVAARQKASVESGGASQWPWTWCDEVAILRSTGNRYCRDKRPDSETRLT